MVIFSRVRLGGREAAGVTNAVWWAVSAGAFNTNNLLSHATPMSFDFAAPFTNND